MIKRKISTQIKYRALRKIELKTSIEETRKETL